MAGPKQPPVAGARRGRDALLRERRSARRRIPNFTLAALDDNLPGGHSPGVSSRSSISRCRRRRISWADDPVAFETLYPHFFLAHEVAHQWWGQAVGWKNYHEQWLSEGLAQYFAALYAAEDRGAATCSTSLLSADAGVRDGAYRRQGPIDLGYRLGHIQGDGRVFRAIVYNKSAVVLHMLRRLMGDEAFFRGPAAVLSRLAVQEGRHRRPARGVRSRNAAQARPLLRALDSRIDDSAAPRDVAESRRAAGVPRPRSSRSARCSIFPLTVSVQYADGRPKRSSCKSPRPSSRSRSRSRRRRRIAPRDELIPAEIVGRRYRTASRHGPSSARRGTGCQHLTRPVRDGRLLGQAPFHPRPRSGCRAFTWS